MAIIAFKRGALPSFFEATDRPEVSRANVINSPVNSGGIDVNLPLFVILGFAGAIAASGGILLLAHRRKEN